MPPLASSGQPPTPDMCVHVGRVWGGSGLASVVGVGSGDVGGLGCVRDVGQVDCVAVITVGKCSPDLPLLTRPLVVVCVCVCACVCAQPLCMRM